MKTLIVIRHAKSERDLSSLADIDRALTDHGKHDALLMGDALKGRRLKPDLIVTSPARRAFETAELIAKAVDYDCTGIAVYESIYLQEAPVLIELIRSFENAYNTVYLIGHNPCLTELVTRLTGENLDDLPTCGTAQIEFSVDAWTDILPGSGRLVFFDSPKQHR